jgi:hypothetical protein
MMRVTFQLEKRENCHGNRELAARVAEFEA